MGYRLVKYKDIAQMIDPPNAQIPNEIQQKPIVNLPNDKVSIK